MKEITLTRGYVALVDDEDYESLSAHKWSASVCMKNDGIRTVYARRYVMAGKRRQRIIHMHREILKAPHGYHVDHVDGDGINNVRSNLRLANNQENGMNRRKSETIAGKKATSRFKGVSWRKHERRWVAKIKHDGKQTTLGYFKSEEDAAMAYNAAATEFFGEYANTNPVTNRAAFPGAFGKEG